MKKVIIGCLSTAAVIMAVVAVGVWFWLLRETPVLDATMSLPLETQVESTVTMVITVTNVHTTPVTLDSIDVDDSFLSGFQVVSISPEPDDTMHVPLAKQRSWDFGTPIAPNASRSVTFTMRAVAEGHFSGDVDICNPNQDFRTLLADVVVRKQVSSKPSEAASP